MNNTILEIGKYYYFGDVNPEHGGVICTKLENGSIEAWEIGEYSAINFCTFIGWLYVEKEYEVLGDFLTDYYEGEIFSDGCEPLFKLMKSIDWEYANESNKDVIDQFLRYDYNISNLIKKYIGISKHVKIIGLD